MNMHTLQRWVLILGVVLTVGGVLLSVMLPYFHPVAREARAIHVELLLGFGLDADVFVDRNIDAVPIWPAVFVMATFIAMFIVRRRQRRRSAPIGKPMDTRGRSLETMPTLPETSNPYLVPAGIQAVGLCVLAYRSILNLTNAYNVIGAPLTQLEFADGCALSLQAYLVPLALNLLPFLYLGRKSVGYLRQNPLVWFPTVLTLAEFIMFQGFGAWSVRLGELQFERLLELYRGILP